MANQPNVLILHSDEHSFRFLSARSKERGGEDVDTPTMDGLVEQGVNFDAACCQYPLCTPSRIAMLTGRHAHRCGAWSNGSILRPELPSIGSQFQANGYKTATAGKFHLGGSLQHAGFSARPYGDFGGPCGHQDDPFHSDGGMRSRTIDAGISDVPEAFLQENMIVRESVALLREHKAANPEQPWLVYNSFSRPHFPLTCPRRFYERYYPDRVTDPRVGHTGDTADHPMTLGAIKGFRTDEITEEEVVKGRSAYFGSVSFLDEILGDYLAILNRDGLLDNTVIIYTSDHGDMVGEHGLWWKNTWHEGSMHVPLIVSLPEHRSGGLASSEVTQAVSLADLFPTLCGLTDTPKPDGLDGVDLSDAIRGDSCAALDQRVGAITESLNPRWGEGTEFRMIRSENYKYVAFRDCEDIAIDMQADPDEQHNLVGKATGDVAAELEKMRSEVLDGFSFDEVEAERDRDQKELRAKYPKRTECKTPNQILLGDGRLVEADAPLYLPEIVSRSPAEDFDDFPG